MPVFAGVRDILATNQAGELRKVFGPSQFGEQGAQSDEPVDIGGGGEGRRLGVQVRHPAEEVGLPSQLLEGVHLGVSGAEIAEEVADAPAVVTNASPRESTARSKRGASGCERGRRRARFMTRASEGDELAAPRRAYTAGRRLAG